MTSNIPYKHWSLTEQLVSNHLFKMRKNLMSKFLASFNHRLYFRHLTKNPFKKHTDSDEGIRNAKMLTDFHILGLITSPLCCM